VVTAHRPRGAQFIEFVACFSELMVRSAWVFGSGCKGFAGQSASKSRTARFPWGATEVWAEILDGPLHPRGQSAPPLRTVCL
jgi:hypothetical protein